MTRIHRSLACLILSITVVVTGCLKKKPEKPKSARRQHEQAIVQANDEQAALDKFAGAVRDILLWNQSQPAASEAGRRQNVNALAQKMEQVPVEGLPQELSKAWDLMLKDWQALAKTETPAAALREQGAKAAAELNRQLAAHGVTDIRF